MEKRNIMLLFMSNLRGDPESRKYKGKYKEQVIEVEGKQTNEAPTKYILKCLGENRKLEKIYILRTNSVNTDTVASEGMTTYEFFKEQLYQYCKTEGYAIPQLEPIEYDENAKGQDGVKSIFKMINQIKEDGYSQNTNVYVDMTGGLRNSTMLLLSIIKLLQYSGIHLKQVLYSNKDIREIEDVTNIYEIYDVIAGAQEFTQFGSVQALKEYYKKKDKSEELRDLLDKMNEFSEHLQLCKASEFQSCLKELRNCIRAFKQKCTENNTQEELFKTLLDRIEEDYKDIIAEDTTIPVIIKWCAQRGFIQQALTLYTELIPVYLVDSGIITPKTTKEEEFCKKNSVKYQAWQVYFINTFITVNQDDEKVKLREFERMIQAFGKGEVIEPDDINLKEVLKELKIFDTPEKIRYDKLKSHRIKKLIDTLYQQYKNTGSLDKSQYISKKLTREKVCNQIRGSILVELLDLQISTIRDKCSNDEKAQKLVDSKYINIAEEQAAQVIKVLKNYYDIKAKRNTTNHANGENTTIEDVATEAEMIKTHMELILSLT